MEDKIVSKNESKIKLNFFDGTGSVWNTECWKRIRELRIVGTFVGTLAHLPYQVKDNGFPLLLSKNETTLLLEKEFADVIVNNLLLSEPDESIGEKLKIQRQHSFSLQRVLLKDQRKQEIVENADLIVQGKLKKRRKKNETDPQEERQNIIAEEINKIADPTDHYLSIHIPTVDPWASTDEPVEWIYPKLPSEIVSYQVFRYLWMEGYWITPGTKFGGDFLVYPGDPYIYHADFIIRLVGRKEEINPLDLVGFARLANSTKKTAVLAYLTEDNKVTFQSLSWVSE